MTTNRGARDSKLEQDIQDVTDPRDFLQTSLPQMMDIDTLLRCHICKDFIKIPVLTPCGHTFCSLCIREYLNRELKCPLCLAELRESMLRSEFLVNEIIESYKQARVHLLEALDKHNKSVAAQDEDFTIEIASGDNEEEASDDDIKIIETRASRPAKRVIGTVTSGGKRARQELGNSGITAMFGKSKEKSQGETASCPICNKSFSLDYLQRTHLDDCLVSMNSAVKTEYKPTSEPETKSRSPAFESHITKHTNRYLESGQNKNSARLPKLNFPSMSQSQLKQKLSSLSLPVNGNRQQMINRYNHFEMLWNSNFLDSMEPVSERDLRRKLASWEASHNNGDNIQGKSSISTMLSGKTTLSRLKDFKNDRFDRKGWIRAHRTEFQELLMEARDSLKKMKNSEQSSTSHSMNKPLLDQVIPDSKDVQLQEMQTETDQLKEEPSSRI